jgi:hypothetical protein
VPAELAHGGLGRLDPLLAWPESEIVEHRLHSELERRAVGVAFDEVLGGGGRLQSTGFAASAMVGIIVFLFACLAALSVPCAACVFTSCW